MSRAYTRLPSTEEVVRLWHELGEDGTRVAFVIGCSESAVSRRLQQAGVERVRPVQRARLRMGPRIEALEQQLADLAGQVADLNRAVAALVAMPHEAVKIVEWKPDHRRLADGGEQVRKQRRRVRELVAGL